MSLSPAPAIVSRIYRVGHVACSVATVLAVACIAPVLAAAVPETPVLPIEHGAPATPSDSEAPVPPSDSRVPVPPDEATPKDVRDAGAHLEPPAANPDALVPIGAGRDTYDFPVGGTTARATAPAPGVIGPQRSFARHTVVDTHITLGAGTAAGEGGVPSGTAFAAQIELRAVSDRRVIFSGRGTYMNVVDSERRLIMAGVRAGYRLWGGVHGRPLGFTDDKLLVRSTRSGLFVVGSMSFVNFGKYTYTDDEGYLWAAPEDSIHPGLGLTFEQRRRRSTIIFSADALREVVRGEWGARGRVVIRVRRFSAGVAFTTLDRVLEHTQLTAGLMF